MPKRSRDEPDDEFDPVTFGFAEATDGESETDNDAAYETGASVECPYCAEIVEITLDPGSGPLQEYVEDCEVCCQPWQVAVAFDARGHAEVTVTALDS
jgi:hypothetical protein